MALGSKATRQKIREYISGIDKFPVGDAQPPTQVGQAESSKTSINGVEYGVEKQIYTARANLAKYLNIANPVQDTIWPGALVQGNSIASGLLTPIGLDRSAGTITVATEIPGEPEATRSLLIDQPSHSSVLEARYKLLNAIAPHKSAATVSADICEVHSLQQAMFQLGVDYKQLTSEISSKFHVETSLEQHALLVRFAQEYYTVTFEPSGSPSFYFADSVSLEEIKTLIADDSPPCYISQVTYGRMLFLMVTATASSVDLEASVKAAMDWGVESGKIDADAKYMNVLKSSNIKVLSWGADGSAAVDLITDPIKNLAGYLREGNNFDLEHLGAPISYTLRYLKDQEFARTTLTTEWDEKKLISRDVDLSFDKILPGGDGSKARIDTGIRVAPGDQITISASGKIWSGYIFYGANDPDGMPGWIAKIDENFPVSDEQKYCLIGGYNGQDWFKIGRKKSWTYTGAPSNLWLGVNTNDVHTGDGGNHSVDSGGFSVRVQVKRKTY